MNANDREARGEALVDEARQRLAEISFPSTLAACLHHLRHNPNDGMGWYERRPFIAFLMLKWSAELRDPTADRRMGLAADFDFVQQKIWDAIGFWYAINGPQFCCVELLSSSSGISADLRSDPSRARPCCLEI